MRSLRALAALAAITGALAVAPAITVATATQAAGPSADQTHNEAATRATNYFRGGGNPSS